MWTLLSIIGIGFFLGMRHATDPDHVIAVTTIVTQQKRTSRAALIGMMWGVGHTVTIFIVGAAIILFNLVIPTRLGLTMELSVGFMLILLGVWNLVSFWRDMPKPVEAAAAVEVHSHWHSHEGYAHNHPHTHGPDGHAHSLEENSLGWMDRAFGGLKFYQWLRPLVIGVVHGLAGSAAVALLILASIKNSTWAIVYLLVFGVGTIAGMMLITMSLASTFRFVGNRMEGFSRKLGLASGLLSVGFGLFVAYEICVVQGLFSANPQWSPH
jgi:high-affinity nickel-transport protein